MEFSIETSRMILRPIAIEDCELVFNYRSDKETNLYQSWIPDSIDDVQSFISKNPTQINIPDTWFQLVIITKQDNQVIGDIGLHFLDDNHQAEIGITLSKHSQNQGYATEALQSVLSYLFSDLKKHRIIASIDPNNIPSIRLMNRLGFRKEAHFRESYFHNGKWADDVIFAMLRSEYENMNS